MERRLFRRLSWAIAGLLTFAAASYFSDGAPTAWLTDATAPLGRGVRGITYAIGRAVGVTQERDALRAQLEAVYRQEALTTTEREELAFYRSVLKVQDSFAGHSIVIAHIFAAASDVGGSTLSLDRGLDDGIHLGDVVLTASGSFVGIIADASARHGTVHRLQDPLLQIAARVAGTDVTGLVHRTSDGVVLDLVRKDESVTEGAVVMTSGDDRLPPGLILGTISSIDRTSTALFQRIRLSPSHPNLDSGPVLVLHP